MLAGDSDGWSTLDFPLFQGGSGKFGVQAVERPPPHEAWGPNYPPAFHNITCRNNEQAQALRAIEVGPVVCHSCVVRCTPVIVRSPSLPSQRPPGEPIYDAASTGHRSSCLGKLDSKGYFQWAIVHVYQTLGRAEYTRHGPYCFRIAGNCSSQCARPSSLCVFNRVSSV